MNIHSGTQEALTGRVVETVAEEKGVDETELPPLYNTIDPDALERLFRNGSGQAVFEYADYNVTVHADGTVELTPRETK